MIARARAIAAAALVCGVAIFSACSRAPSPGEAYRIDVTIRPDPPAVGPATVDVVLADPAGAPVERATVRVEGNMNHAGMVPSIGDAKELEAGHYRADIEFTMGGDWFLLVEAKLRDGPKVERTIQVPAVKRR